MKALEKLMDLLDKSFLTRWINVFLWRIWVDQMMKKI